MRWRRHGRRALSAAELKGFERAEIADDDERGCRPVADREPPVVAAGEQDRYR